MQPGVWNMEQCDPDPFMEDMNRYGLPWTVVELARFPARAEPWDRPVAMQFTDFGKLDLASPALTLLCGGRSRGTAQSGNPQHVADSQRCQGAGRPQGVFHVASGTIDIHAT